MTQSSTCNCKALRGDLDPQRDPIKEGYIPNKWRDSRMTVGMTAGSVLAMWWKKVNFQQIDEWDLVHQKGKPSGTKVIGKCN